MKSLHECAGWHRTGGSSGAAARMLCSAGLLLLGALGAATALAQLSSVRLIVPFATGGPTNIGARVIAPYLGELTKRTVIVAYAKANPRKIA